MRRTITTASPQTSRSGLPFLSGLLWGCPLGLSFAEGTACTQATTASSTAMTTTHGCPCISAAPSCPHGGPSCGKADKPDWYKMSGRLRRVHLVVLCARLLRLLWYLVVLALDRVAGRRAFGWAHRCSQCSGSWCASPWRTSYGCEAAQGGSKNKYPGRTKNGYRFRAIDRQD